MAVSKYPFKLKKNVEIIFCISPLILFIVKRTIATSGKSNKVG